MAISYYIQVDDAVLGPVRRYGGELLVVLLQVEEGISDERRNVARFGGCAAWWKGHTWAGRCCGRRATTDVARGNCGRRIQANLRGAGDGDLPCHNWCGGELEGG